MGNPATPLEKRKLLGNPSRRPMPQPEIFIAAASSTPEAPKQLGNHGVTVWNRVWTACAAWISPQTDIALVTRYCEAVDEREEMKAIVSREGMMVDATGGTTKAHPMIKCIRDLDSLLTKYEGLMGLTPSDRAKLGLVEVKKQDALLDFMTNRDKVNKTRA